MEITLEKIELVKDRTGVTYAEAKQALEETDGSVVDAIIAIEEIINTGEKKKGFGKKGEALFSRLKEIVMYRRSRSRKTENWFSTFLLMLVLWEW